VSSPLAIAATTAVLRERLETGLLEYDLSGTLGTVDVSAIPPDRVVPEGVADPNQLNLFMYRATPNTGWSNQQYAARSSGGDRIANPPLALDLHYLLTAFGASDLHAELLLGCAMHLFHETPFLDRDVIRNALTPSPGGGGALDDLLTLLGTANLADQFEQLRITPETLNTEEMSKLWSALQTHYRPSSAYVVTVVLLERHRPARSAPRVAERRLHVRQLRHPHIDSLEPDVVEVGGSLRIRGYNLKADPVRLSFVDAFVTPADDDVTDERIDVTLPNGLQAGVNSVQVIHDLEFGTPGAPAPDDPYPGFESNAAIFLLRPTITPGEVTAGIGPTHSGSIETTFDPAVGRRQRVVMLLNEFDAPADRPPHAYSFEVPPRNADSDPDATTSLALPFRGVAGGQYLVRVQVDGAESALTFTLGSPVYNDPLVTIP
jgi:hypothetical protein